MSIGGPQIYTQESQPLLRLCIHLGEPKVHHSPPWSLFLSYTPTSNLFYSSPALCSHMSCFHFSFPPSQDWLTVPSYGIPFLTTTAKDQGTSKTMEAYWAHSLKAAHYSHVVLFLVRAALAGLQRGGWHQERCVCKRERDQSEPERQCEETSLAPLIPSGGSTLKDLISAHKAKPVEDYPPPQNITTLSTKVLIHEPFGGQTIF